MAPLAGRVAVAKFLGATPSRIAWSPIDVRVSRAGDMAVSHGKFRSFGPDAKSRAGYYVHLWLRDAAGRWRLAYDIATAE
jgi:ketosteroid isomerase-like protein